MAQSTQARFAIFKHLLKDGEGVISVHHDPAKQTLQVRVDRDKILTHGKPAIARMVTNIHIWRCIGDIKSCEDFWGPLTSVADVHKEWRKIVMAHPEPQAMFVQANTFLGDDNDKDVHIKVYDESAEGIIRSFAERGC
jgi:dipeptidyl-peptidase-3